MNDESELPTIDALFGPGAGGGRLPEAVEALGPAIERGHNLAIIAGEGARLCRLYAACCLRDLTEGMEGDDPPRVNRALVLAATPDRATRLARSIHRVLDGSGLEVLAWGTGAGAVSGAARTADIVVGTPARVLEDLRAGALPLGELALLALDDVRGLEPEWPAVEAILQTATEETRRVAVTHTRDRAFDDLIERRLPRARRWPPELFDEPDGDRPFVAIGVGAAETHDARLERLVALLHGWAAAGEVERVGVWCDTESVAASVRSALEIQGFAVAPGAGAAAAGSGEDDADADAGKDDAEADAEGGDADADAARPGASGADHAGVIVRTFAAVADAPAGTGSTPPNAAVAFGLPWTPDELAPLGPAGRRYAIVAPRHFRQMEILAERLGWTVKPLGDLATAHHGDLAAFRARVEEAIESRDLAGDALLIEPLVEEHGYHRVAAALAGLARELERGLPGEPPHEEDRPPRGAKQGARAAWQQSPKRGAVSSDAERATSPTWTRLFVNVGKQDGASPGDFVGAITGETRAAGAQIGKIEIKPRFTLIDVDSLVAEDVVRQLRGKRLKGRDVEIRLDRGR